MEGSGSDTAKNVRAGLTVSERYLAALARRSFLSIWSYANLFTDEGRKHNKGNGKELCDLVVVFGNNILLFSDKSCRFPEHQDIKVAWSRWYKRAIEKSARQLIGAEAWIRRFPDRIFLDQSCSTRFPFPIPDVTRARFFKFAVTRGAYKHSSRFFGGQSTGSLMIDTTIKGAAHLNKPFCVGHVAPNSGYIHVLDELTLEVLLRELDTVSDLVAYLQKKELLILKSGCQILATGEEQLVANYLSQSDENGNHNFSSIPDACDGIFFDEGPWQDFIHHPQYRAKKEADRISYAWDRLIERFCEFGRNHAGVSFSESLDAIADAEPALRVMASENRLRRRQLAERLVEALQTKVAPGSRLIRLVASNDLPDTVYVFLVVPQPNEVGYEEYRERRKAFLLACCKVAMLHAPKSRQVVGIAAEPEGSNGGSEDLFLLASDSGWTQEDLTEAKELQQELGILQEARMTWHDSHDKEYPDVDIDSHVTTPPVVHPRTSGPNRAQRREMERKRRREAKRKKRR